MEIWKSVAGYEGIYEVSNLGNVRSVDRTVPSKYVGTTANIKGKQLKPIITTYGYMRVNLCDKDGRKSKFVHRLVAEAFIENPDNLPQINHKDENKLNNSVDNLEWCSAKYNSNYGTHKLRISLNARGKKHNLSKQGLERIRKINGKPIIATNIVTGEQMQFKCAIDAEKQGFKRWSIYQCANGHCKQYKNHIWRYCDE